MVRLEHMKSNNNEVSFHDLHSTMVRLELLGKHYNKMYQYDLHSTMVRLEPYRGTNQATLCNIYIPLWLD